MNVYVASIVKRVNKVHSKFIMMANNTGSPIVIPYHLLSYPKHKEVKESLLSRYMI